jgi:maltooligosyltrehalose trehalohydrolase
MGQEWAARSRFLFFTDHHADLGRLVTAGRRAEFSRFAAFADPIAQTQIPDPQAYVTFAASRLVWEERAAPPHAGVLELYRTLLQLRRDEIVLLRPFEVIDIDDACLALVRGVRPGGVLLLIVCLGGPRPVDLAQRKLRTLRGRWEVVMTTEESRFCEQADAGAAAAPAIELDAGLAVTFRRPSAVILRSV